MPKARGGAGERQGEGCQKARGGADGRREGAPTSGEGVGLPKGKRGRGRRTARGRAGGERQLTTTIARRRGGGRGEARRRGEGRPAGRSRQDRLRGSGWGGKGRGRKPQLRSKEGEGPPQGGGGRRCGGAQRRRCRWPRTRDAAPLCRLMPPPEPRPSCRRAAGGRPPGGGGEVEGRARTRAGRAGRAAPAPRRAVQAPSGARGAGPRWKPGRVRCPQARCRDSRPRPPGGARRGCSGAGRGRRNGGGKKKSFSAGRLITTKAGRGACLLACVTEAGPGRGAGASDSFGCRGSRAPANVRRLCYGHTIQNTPDPIRTPKLSWIGLD